MEGWTGTIEEGVCGLAAATWASNSRAILTFSELNLRVTVWSLTDESPTAYINSPKMLPPKGIDYSSNKKFMALAERQNCKDVVSIYYADNDWKMVNTFDVETMDMSDLKWTMNDGAIIVWDNPIESRFIVYSAMTG